jgi:cytoskeletal protein RodZ
VPAKSKHMERRKQRIANAKKNARLAAKLRRRRRLQATFGLLAIIVVVGAGYLWQSGFFESDEPAEDPAVTEAPTSETGESPPEEPTDAASESASAETGESPTAETTE